MRRAEQVPANKPNAQQLMVVSLYAAMGPDQQLQVFQPAPAGTRKVLHSALVIMLQASHMLLECNHSSCLTHLRQVLGFVGDGILFACS